MSRPVPDAVAGLVNLGPKSSQWLRDAGITSYDDLEELGAAEAYLRVKVVHPEVSLHLLYALEGALLDVRWDYLPDDVKARLRREAGRE
jgi:DNA transformation protein